MRNALGSRVFAGATNDDPNLMQENMSKPKLFQSTIIHICRTPFLWDYSRISLGQKRNKIIGQAGLEPVKDAGAEGGILWSKKGP